MSSRTKKTAINSFVGIGCSLANNLLSFVLQAVFIRLLGVEYSGINNLFTSILSVLNIVEMGFRNAIIFRLYKYIAEEDNEKISMYMTVYKKITYVTGAIIFASGMCCIPFLDKLVTTDKTFSEPLWSLFIIVVATSVVGHINDYRRVLIIAKQERYIEFLVNFGCIFACHIMQIIGLLIVKNIYVYLLIKLFATLFNGFISGYISKKRYGISWNSKQHPEKGEIKNLSKDLGSLAFYKFCRTLDANIDTFLISKYVDIAVTGIFGSVNMLLNSLTEMLGIFNDGMIASVGDLYASESNKKHIEEVFYQSTHFTYFIFGICISVLAPFLSPFTKWWIGYTLDDAAIYVLLINFFMYGMGMNVATFRNSMGIFVKGWKRPGFTAAANIIFSVLLVRRLGLIGTLLGTLIARTITQVWYDPLLVCKHGLSSKPYKYYAHYIAYVIVIFVISFGMIKLSEILPPMDSFISLLWHGIVFAVCSFFAYFCVSFVFKEHKGVMLRMFKMLKSVIEKTIAKLG